MSSNYYIREGFNGAQLFLYLIEQEARLKELGALYEDRNLKNPSDFQMDAMALHRDGYTLDDQIHDCYAEIGAIMQAQELV